jgi:hypothetical protein
LVRTRRALFRRKKGDREREAVAHQAPRATRNGLLPYLKG